MKNFLKNKLVLSFIFVIIICLIAFIIFDNKKDNTIEEQKTITEETVDSVEETLDGNFNINEDNLEQEKFEETNEDLAGAIDYEIKNEEDLISASSQRVYYSQIDSRWSNKMYSSVGNRSQTIGTSGCGPTSAAMVVSSIKGVVYPDTMADLYVKHGFRTASNGTYLSAFQWTANYYGIEFTRTSSLDTAINLLNNGYIMVASCQTGLFTTEGHLIAIMGISGDTMIIHDPYLYTGKFNSYGRSGKVTQSGTTVYCSISNFRNYANCSNFFAYKTNGSYTPDTPVTPSQSGTIKYVSTKKGLNVRSDKNTSSRIIEALPFNTQVTVYEDSNGWSKIGEGQYCSSQYLSSTITNTTSTQPSNIPNTTGKSYRLKNSANIYAKSSMTGTSYNYLPQTQIIVLSNISNTIDYIKVVKTGRVGYIYKSNYTSTSISTNTTKNTTTKYKSNVGSYYRFTKQTNIYSKSNLSGTAYNYLAQTQIKVLSHASSSVDYVQVVKTGRKGYVNVNAYK